MSQQAGTDLGFSPEDLISLVLCGSYCALHCQKKKWEIGEVDGEFELNVKRGEAGKLSTMLLLKLKLKRVTAEQKRELLKQ
jgi:putative redox protein